MRELEERAVVPPAVVREAALKDVGFQLGAKGGWDSARGQSRQHNPPQNFVSLETHLERQMCSSTSINSFRTEICTGFCVTAKILGRENTLKDAGCGSWRGGYVQTVRV